jgi:hypothetical protein
MVDSTWDRGNFLGRIEVCRYVPRRTLKVKLACSNRSALRVSIGIAGAKDATKAEHEMTPEVLNGWPLFGDGNNVGEVLLAGPGDESPLELGIDLTPLLEKLGSEAKGEGRLFLRVGRSEKSEVTGAVQACAVRSYDDKGGFVGESVIEIKDGAFGASALTLETVLP